MVAMPASPHMLGRRHPIVRLRAAWLCGLLALAGVSAHTADLSSVPTVMRILLLTLEFEVLPRSMQG